jgi:hypothetical protein
MSKVPEIADIYVTSAQEVTPGPNTPGGLTFTATAVPTPAAQSHRINQYVKAAKK